MEAKIREIIAYLLSVDITKVVDSANIMDDLGADSLDIVEIVLELEEEFSVEINDDAMENAKTVKDVIKAVADLMPQ